MSEMEHFHTDEPTIQAGWLGRTGRFYGLDEDVTEPGGFSPIYRHWGEKCGHQIQSEDMAMDMAAAMAIAQIRFKLWFAFCVVLGVTVLGVGIWAVVNAVIK